MLAAILLWTLISDIRTRRVPNAAIALGLLLGFGCNVIAPVDSVHGLFFHLGAACAGAIIGLAVFLPAYLLGALGAGDVKLMSCVGAFLGPLPVLGAALLTMLAGALVSLIAAVRTRSLGRVTNNLHTMLALMIADHRVDAIRGLPTTGRVPYVVAIASGTALQLVAAQWPMWVFK